ncbi:MAG: hypothetical protein ACLQHS_13085, partial [Candidatus Limnocylindrales bacterium]
MSRSTGTGDRLTFEKLGVTDRTSAVTRAIERRFIWLPRVFRTGRGSRDQEAQGRQEAWDLRTARDVLARTSRSRRGAGAKRRASVHPARVDARATGLMVARRVGLLAWSSAHPGGLG